MIADIDILKENDLTDLCNACNVPEALKQGIAATKGTLAAEFAAAKLDMKSGGLRLLPPASQEAGHKLLAQLGEYGIFVVPNGEVESWLEYLKVAAQKRDWLPEMFASMGSDPSAAEYVRPQAGDVWEFIQQIAAWVADSKRAGMPH